MKAIAERTSAKITSPVVKNNVSDRMFKVEGSMTEVVNTLTVLASYVNFFHNVIQDRLKKKDDEIIDYFPIKAEDLCRLLADNGIYIISLRQNFGINIISPKPYSEDIKFILIGKRVSCLHYKILPQY